MQVQIGNENNKMETTKEKKNTEIKNFVTVTKNTIDFKKPNVMCVLSHVQTL